MVATSSPDHALRPPDPETFDAFRSLGLQEVLRRAEEAEARSAPSDASGPSPCAKPAWRRLYRDMRQAQASTVDHLKRRTVERHASTLGYGYFRIRVNSADAFMPLPR
jgi:hypothetical protein